MSGERVALKPALPPLLHVGIVVLDLEAAAADFHHRWRAPLTDVADVTLHDALYHNRAVTMSFRRGLIRSGASHIELTQPLTDSPFRDFLRERRGDGVHHLAYVVDDIDAYLDGLRPIGSEFVLDAQVTEDRSRVVLLDGFAHGPAIELIQLGVAGEHHD